VIVTRHLPLYLCTNWFDYLGSIVNYAAVGLSILYLQDSAVGRLICASCELLYVHSKLKSNCRVFHRVTERHWWRREATAACTSSMLSPHCLIAQRYCHRCVVSVHKRAHILHTLRVARYLALKSLVSGYQVTGYTARISELLIAMSFTAADAKRLSWQHFGSGPPPANGCTCSYEVQLHGVSTFWRKWMGRVTTPQTSWEYMWASQGYQTEPRRSSLSITSELDQECGATFPSNEATEPSVDCDAQADMGRPLLTSLLSPLSQTSLHTVHWDGSNADTSAHHNFSITKAAADAFTHVRSHPCVHAYEPGVLLATRGLTVTNPDGKACTISPYIPSL
jgi:hypothetical protein